jgi:RNA polymerase sigma-70 factor (ECF subfamily)
MEPYRKSQLQPFPLQNLAKEAAPANEELDLVQAARRDPAAFEPLYRYYLSPVYRYLRLRCGSEEEAADLTQQVFLRALAALPDYRPQGLPFSAWLFRIARNAAIDAHRRQHSTVAWNFLPEALHPVSAQDPESMTLQQERLAQLRDLLAKLSQDKRELLALRFASGLTAPEIAAVVGKSEAAVKKQLTRLIAHLKEQYREQFNDA